MHGHCFLHARGVLGGSDTLLHREQSKLQVSSHGFLHCYILLLHCFPIHLSAPINAEKSDQLADFATKVCSYRVWRHLGDDSIH